MSLKDRLVHGWNVFVANKDPTYYDRGTSYSRNPSRIRLKAGNEQSIINAVCTRIALDCTTINISHCRLDDNKRYVEDIDSYLNECLRVSANIDQTGKTLLQDIIISMFDEGVVAVVPVETTLNPAMTSGYDITNLRTGKIIEWFPDSVKVNVYNEKTGKREDILVSKSLVAIIENPFYSVMNERNSTVQRLNRKLNLSDIIDEQTSSGKMNIIIQLPYTIKTDAKQKLAEQRLKALETQMATSKYGIAYADSAEHITQLNRSLENNILESIEYLTNLFYSQLGITQEIMNGTADDKVMNNYYSRTIEPILTAICDEMKRKFLTKTARSQGQSIEFFRDPFKLLPPSDFADISDKMTRNEIMTTNEMRQKIGMKPAEDPRADELRNKNLSEAKGEQHLNIDGENITDGYLDASNNPEDTE